MVAQAITETIPIYEDKQGRYRIGKTRVLFDLLIHAYHRGETPETIVDMYPTLALDDVYLVIAYYLRHRAEMDVYLQQQQHEADNFQKTYLEENPPTLTREILMARLAAKKQQDAT